MRTLSILAGLLGLLTLCGCSDDKASAEAEKTYTVEQLMADEPLLVKLVDECKNNPGEIGAKPNCVNAMQASHKLKIEKELQKLKQ